MSNAVNLAETQKSETDVTAKLISCMNKTLDTLNAGSYPSVTECDVLQDLLRAYIDSISSKGDLFVPEEQTKESGVRIEFTDQSDYGIRSNDIITELSSDAVFPKALYKIALRKIVKTEELDISDSQRTWLENKGYLAMLTVIQKQKADHYIALTSKGWLCFRRKNIARQVRKNQGNSSLVFPEWLITPQMKWSPKTYQQAVLLRNYYQKNTVGKDYMIFSFPENSRILFGCQANADKNVTYTCAFPENALITEDEKETLLKVIDSDAVYRVILVKPLGDSEGTMIESLHLKPAAAEKIDIYVMEEAYE